MAVISPSQEERPLLLSANEMLSEKVYSLSDERKLNFPVLF